VIRRSICSLVSSGQYSFTVAVVSSMLAPCSVSWSHMTCSAKLVSSSISFSLGLIVNQLAGNGSGNKLTPSLAAHIDCSQMIGAVKDMTDALCQCVDGAVYNVIG